MAASSVVVTVGSDLSVALSGPAAGVCSVTLGSLVQISGGWVQSLQLTTPPGARVERSGPATPHGAVIDDSEAGVVLLKGWGVPHPDRSGAPVTVEPGNFPREIVVPLVGVGS